MPCDWNKKFVFICYLLISFNLIFSSLSLADTNPVYETIKNEAEQGNAESQMKLGKMYFNGEGVEQNKIKAFDWFLKSAKNGNVISQLFVGSMYSDGDIITQDKTKSFQWMLKAAKNGNVAAQTFVGATYYEGDVIPKDDSKGFSWLLKAAENGDVKSQKFIGIMYNDKDVNQQDKEKSFKWVFKEAENGNQKAQYQIGKMYYYGDGVKKNKTEALIWYTKSAEQGNLSSQYDLAYIMVMDNDVKKDNVSAFKWMLNAAENGHPKAQMLLGTMYEDGVGVTKNKNESLIWYRKSLNNPSLDDRYKDMAAKKVQEVEKEINAEQNVVVNKETCERDDTKGPCYFDKRALLCKMKEIENRNSERGSTFGFFKSAMKSIDDAPYAMSIKPEGNKFTKKVQNYISTLYTKCEESRKASLPKNSILSLGCKNKDELPDILLKVKDIIIKNNNTKRRPLNWQKAFPEGKHIKFKNGKVCGNVASYESNSRDIRVESTTKYIDVTLTDVGEKKWKKNAEVYVKNCSGSTTLYSIAGIAALYQTASVFSLNCQYVSGLD